MNTELLAWATAGGVITLFCLWMRDTRAAESGEPIAADLRATKCKLCSHILGVDRKWHPEAEVTFPASCRLEVAICNHCQLLADARKGGVPTGALEDIGPKLRPVFAGAETL
jgi:hypothetical protein